MGWSQSRFLADHIGRKKWSLNTSSYIEKVVLVQFHISCLGIRVSNFTLFFLIELSPFNHSCSWVVGVHKKKFQRYRPKIDVQRKIFVFALFTREKGPK